MFTIILLSQYCYNNCVYNYYVSFSSRQNIACGQKIPLQKNNSSLFQGIGLKPETTVAFVCNKNEKQK